MPQDLEPAPVIAVPYVTTQRYSSNRTYVIKTTTSVDEAWRPVFTEEVALGGDLSVSQCVFTPCNCRGDLQARLSTRSVAQPVALTVAASVSK